MNATELQTRLKNFAYRVVVLCESLPGRKTSKIIEDQLLRSAFFAAANCRAACKAQPDKAFKATLSIAFKEIGETLFWLEAIVDLKLKSAAKLTLLVKEANELTRSSHLQELLWKRQRIKILNFKY